MRTWRETWTPLIENARWAPSGDNGQPWRVQPCSDACRAWVVLDESQPLAFLDYQGEASRIAIGAFLENLRLAATLHGQAMSVEKIVDVDSTRLHVEIRLDEDVDASPDPMARLVEMRHSNRKKQSTIPLSDELVEQLQAAGNQVKGIETRIVTDRETIGSIADSVAIADHVRFMHELCHKEFHEKVRWSEQDAKKMPTGFSADTFEIGRIERFALKTMASFKILCAANKLVGIGSMAAKAAKQQVLHSSGIGVIQGNPNDENIWINIGVTLQRVWLAASAIDDEFQRDPKSGLSRFGFQVLAVAPILTRRLRDDGNNQFNSWQQNKLSHVDTLLRNALGSSDEIAIMFRVGQTSPATARTMRLPWQDLVINMIPGSNRRSE